MAARKRSRKKPHKKQRVRKTVMIEQAKLDAVRSVLDLRSDAEVLRFALDHLLSHFEEPHHEEEE